MAEEAYFVTAKVLTMRPKDDGNDGQQFPSRRMELEGSFDPSWSTGSLWEGCKRPVQERVHSKEYSSTFRVRQQSMWHFYGWMQRGWWCLVPMISMVQFASKYFVIRVASEATDANAPSQWVAQKQRTDAKQEEGTTKRCNQGKKRRINFVGTPTEWHRALVQCGTLVDWILLMD